MKLSRWFRRTLLALALVAVLAGALFAFLQTGPGRSLVASLIESAASSGNFALKVEGLDGTLPGAPHIAKLTIADANGPWLVLHDIAVEWSPLALIGGSIVAEEVSISHADWLREPVSPNGNTSSGGALPSLAIGKLKIASLTVARAVAGAEGAFGLEVSVDTSDLANRAAFALRVIELRPAGAHVNIALAYDKHKSQLDLSGDIADRPGGTLAAMLQLPPRAPLTARLKSEGPLDAWRAKLEAGGGTALRVTGLATLNRRNAWQSLNVDLDADIAAIGPQRWRTLFQGRSKIEIAAAGSDGGALKIERLTANTPAAHLEASGVFDPAMKHADIGAVLSVHDGSKIAPLLGVAAAWHDLTVKAKLQGAWPTPTLNIDANATDVAVDDLRTRALAAHVNATLVDGAKLKGIAADLVATGATLRFAGDADAKIVNGDATLDVPDLSRLGLRGGAIALKTRIDANFETSQWSAEGNGTGRDIALNPLLAGKQDLNFALSGVSFDDARIAALTLTGERSSLIASGALSRKALDIDAKVIVPSLGAIRIEHAGRLDADIHLGGTLDAPRVNGAASLSKGALFGRPVQGLSLTLDKADSSGLSHLAVDGDFNGKPVKGAANVAWQPKGGARIDELDLVFASLALKGAATLDAANLIRGDVRLDAGELADIAPFVGEDIAGALAGTLHFDAAQGKQTLTASLNSPRFRIDTVRLDAMTLNAAMSDVFGSAALTARATARTADLDDFPLQNLKAVGQGPLKLLAVALDAEHDGATLTGHATLKLEGKPTRIAVDALQATKGDNTARLAAPVEVSIGDHRVLIPPARFAVGSGSLILSGDAGRATDLAVTVDRAPLWLAAFVADPLPVAGVASGTARVREHGATAFDVKIANLAPAGEARVIRNLAMAAIGQTDRTGVDFKLTLADNARTSFRADGRLPFAENARLTVDVEGAADLALANVYLSVNGDRARGKLTANAKLTGTLAAPRIGGTGKIADGYFRNAASGFELKDIAAAFDGSERRVAITGLTAKSANGGAVTGRGEIRLEPAAGYPVNLAVTAAKAQLVATEITTVIADVDARLSGGLLRRPQISGTADIDLWEIRLPDRLARPLTPIRVLHRNAPLGAVQDLLPEEDDTEGALIFGLDVSVRAPRRVYVRGQGVEAEFGGQVKVAGTTDKPSVVGRFELRRGAVALLNQRVSLTRGTIAFAGDVVPTLDIAGQVRKSDLTATIALKGKATAPEISLSSAPALPQDEIIARILFNKGTQQLSAFEAAQLAAAIARWSGLSTGPDILESLRTTLGIDSLNAVTDQAGGTAVGAGAYVGSGIYLGFVQGADTTAGRATVDIDLTERIKVRGEAGPTGDTRVGVVAEWEY